MFGSNSGNGWWTGAHMHLQLEDLADCCKIMFPGKTPVLFTDWSQGHARKRPDGLDAARMNKGYGGTQVSSHDTKLGLDSFGPFNNPGMIPKPANSVETIDQHFKFKEARLAKAQTAINVLDRAAELAPVLGLAGTLIALAHAQTVAAETGGVVEAISMAVITTLYGLIAANFLFSPLSSAVSRRWVREERMRDEVLEWLAFKIQKSSRRTHAPHREVQAA